MFSTKYAADVSKDEQNRYDPSAGYFSSCKAVQSLLIDTAAKQFWTVLCYPTSNINTG